MNHSRQYTDSRLGQKRYSAASPVLRAGPDHHSSPHGGDNAGAGPPQLSPGCPWSAEERDGRPRCGGSRPVGRLRGRWAIGDVPGRNRRNM